MNRIHIQNFKSSRLFGRILTAITLLGAGLSSCSPALAFSGEDPVFGHPWYHEQITETAAEQAHWSPEAADAIGWHADYIDSYLYNPLWWGQGGLSRYKASRANLAELEKLHFDDLFSSDKVNYMWRRYASGAFAGLVWAAEHNDVPAAQNIVGVSLHAMQDFYAHSAWIDTKERSSKTFFEYPRARRTNEVLYTGAYEHDHQLGVKSHGKWIPSASIYGQPGVREVMEVACDAASPFSNSDACAAYKAIKVGTPMQPTVAGIKLPPSIMVYTPAGIALDNTWVANESVKQRGIDKETTGAQAFGFARELATRQSQQWLQVLEEAMKKVGPSYEAFWTKVKSLPASDTQRFAQYENYKQFPFTFLSAGEYPPAPSTSDEWFLRVRLKTSTDLGSGTDADIKLRAGGKMFPLDYLPKTNPMLAYNDFEPGDDNIYVVGPFSSCPTNIDLINDAGDGREMFEAIGRDFVKSVSETVDAVGDALLSIAGGHADRIAVNKVLWSATDLASLAVDPAHGRGFSIGLDGGQEGSYRVDGTLFKTAEDENSYEFVVKLDKLACIKESKWDRGSNSDEPFILTALNPLPGGQTSWKSGVFKDVDTGESVVLNQVYGRVRIPKNWGMLNLAITAMESDDESDEARSRLLEKFAGTLENETKDEERTFAEALATSLAPRWKLAEVEVNAWSRNGVVREGQVHLSSPNRWVVPKQFVSFPLDPARARATGVNTDDLLPDLGSPTQPEQPGQPLPETPAPYDISTWVGEWETTYGRVKLTLDNGVLRGRLMQKDEWGNEREGERLELRAGDSQNQLTGTSSYTAFNSNITMTLSGDGNTFTATSMAQVGQTTPNIWSGKRLRASNTPTNSTGPIVPPVTPPTRIPPVTTPPVVTPSAPLPPVIVPGNTAPVSTGQATGDGKFYPLSKFEVRLDKVEVARDKSIHAFLTFKNPSGQQQTIINNTIMAFLEDADGIALRFGALTRASTPDPEPFADQPTLAPGGELKARMVLPTLAGGAPLRSLTLEEEGTTAIFDLSGIVVPGLNLQAFTSAPGASTEWKELGSFDVRFDGARPQRGTQFSEMFFTFKNVKDKIQYIGNPFKISMTDADGAMSRDQGQIYPVRGLSPDSIVWTPWILPGHEGRYRFLIRGPVAPSLTIENTSSGAKQNFATR